MNAKMGTNAEGGGSGSNGRGAGASNTQVNVNAGQSVGVGNIPGNVITPRDMGQLVEQFLKLRPPQFNGIGDPELAPGWIEKLEKIFGVPICTDEEKVLLAVYQPDGTANDRWKATKDGVFPKGTALSWTTFTEVFNDKYFLETARESKLVEFRNLRRGHLIVDQYEAEFARLSMYAPRYVEDPLEKMRRFRDGLRPELRSQMIAMNLRTYKEVDEWGQMIERDMRERSTVSGSRFPVPRDNRQWGKRPMTNPRRFVPLVRRNIGKPPLQSSLNCRLCGRRHGNGACSIRTDACFKCGQVGHQMRFCPNQTQMARPQGLRPQTRHLAVAPQNEVVRPLA
ncbi:uncharacterized protein LOC115746979 [Rhodamnia argentea]|uniref:Uncharacterized protein LOC115746979 n=1 Tax=Rhodamnia argentea TaxID=178133 RepID=A0A8B8PVN3_9MYRT|nr:uncharacterized protein LOC115746979 [Rhodamnia argentea]